MADKINIKEYEQWLANKSSDFRNRKSYEQYYLSITSKIKNDFQETDIWKKFTSNMQNYNDQYLLSMRYELFSQVSIPELLIKPYASFIEKTYRKNVLDNSNWPESPKDGWLLPDNWLSGINDIIRTLITVKYVDGVEYLIQILGNLSQVYGLGFEKNLEARPEGYYAAHTNITYNFEIPKLNWDTEIIPIKIEIQITTQLQEIIRTLLHKYYEQRRMSSDNKQWQWDFESDEFSVNYLGHILHYLEGTIVEIRKRQI